MTGEQRVHENSIHPPPLSIPPIVLDHVGQLNDELSLLVFLTQLKCLLLQRDNKKMMECVKACSV